MATPAKPLRDGEGRGLERTKVCSSSVTGGSAHPVIPFEHARLEPPKKDRSLGLLAHILRFGG